MSIWEATLDRGPAAGDDESGAVVRVYATTEEEAQAKALAYARERMRLETSGHTNDGLAAATVVSVWEVDRDDDSPGEGWPPQPYTVASALAKLRSICADGGKHLPLLMADGKSVVTIDVVGNDAVGYQIVVSDM
jgi:hypothetical protein